MLKNNIVILCVLAILFALILTIQALFDVIVLLSVTILVTYLLLSPVRLVETFWEAVLPEALKKWLVFQPRFLSVAVVYMTCFVLALLVISEFIPILVMQLRAFAHELPGYIQQIELWLKDVFRWETLHGFLQRWLPSAENHPIVSQLLGPLRRGDSLLNHFSELSLQSLADIVDVLQSYAPSALSNLFNVATLSMTSLLYGFTGVVLVFYLLLDGEKMAQGFIQLMPDSQRKHVSEFLSQLHLFFYRFLQSQVLLSLLAGCCMYWVYVAFHIQFAGFLSTFFALAAVFPVIGPLIGLIPSVLVILFSKQPVFLPAILFLTGMYFLLKHYWVEPLLTNNRRSRPHPVVVILSLLVSIQLGGLLGVFLAFPLASLMFVFYLKLQGTLEGSEAEA